MFGCRKSGLRHFFEVFIAPLRLRRGQGAMQGNPCYARLFADLTRTPQGAFSCPFGTIHLVSPNPIKASGGQSRAPPVAGGARRKPSEQGSARKAPRADAARPLRTALRPPNPRGFFDRLRGNTVTGIPPFLPHGSQIRFSPGVSSWPSPWFPGPKGAFLICAGFIPPAARPATYPPSSHSFLRRFPAGCV